MADDSSSGHLFAEPVARPDAPAADAPLAERMRPHSLDEIVGQDDILAPGRPLHEALRQDRLRSVILWGPPGTGKTTLARVMARTTQARFVALSAVMSGVKDIRTATAEAQRARRAAGERTIVFIDEIHRFNKAQQDALLPYVESGDIVLVGATTENPSFEVNAALLSRSRVFVLRALGPDELARVIQRAVTEPERGLGHANVTLGPGVVAAIARSANGDARAALNVLELAVSSAHPTVGADGRPETVVDLDLVASATQHRALRYDKSGEEHFNLVSALHKSIRNSDPDAALYWLARMIESGEDPNYIARRLVRLASEDVGNADPQALSLAVAAQHAVHLIGMPEGDTALAQLVTYLSAAPKSNAVYTAYRRAAADATQEQAEPVPLHLRNAPTRLMRELDYGKDYRYAHDEPEGVADMECLPPSLAGRRYYVPSDRGVEARIRERLDRLRAARASGGAPRRRD